MIVSSDAAITSPAQLSEQLRVAVLEHGFKLDEVLPHATNNTARALRLKQKGRLAEGCDADVLVWRRDSLELLEVIACGKRMVMGGKLSVAENFVRSQGFNRLGTHRFQRALGGENESAEG